MDLLMLEDLHVAFNGIDALAGADLTLLQGERHGLAGVNGSGKSTLLAVAAGQIAADRGRVRLAGRDLSRLPAFGRAQAGIGRVFQESRLWPALSAREHLLVAAAVKPGTGIGLDRMSAAAGVQDTLLDRCPAELTLFERRRLELLLAMYGARVLLCDEIAAGLGSVESESLYALIDTAMEAGWIQGAVMVEHKLDLLLGHVTRVSIMREGRVVASSAESPEAMESAVARHLFDHRAN